MCLREKIHRIGTFLASGYLPCTLNLNRGRRLGGPEVLAMSAILLGLMLIVIFSVELLAEKKS